MDQGVIEAQRREREHEKKEGKGKWGLGKLRKDKKEEVHAKDDDGPEGLRVDQYLVVFLKFMSSIGKSSTFLLGLVGLTTWLLSAHHRS
jgi:ubiquitin-like-conjugating enzyme ATG3